MNFAKFLRAPVFIKHFQILLTQACSKMNKVAETIPEYIHYTAIFILDFEQGLEYRGKHWWK